VKCGALTPVGYPERRDRKGLYRKAHQGEIPNLTGINSPYEASENPEIKLDTLANSSEKCADLIIRYLVDHRLL
jgi:adenylylsulfate kinase-like enzyme